MDDATAGRWDAEYRAGRYRDAPPVAFIDDVLAAARAHGTRSGVYVGCGNGRNFLPLVDAGLDLLGIDLSPVAIAQVAAARPELAARVEVCDLLDVAPAFDLVVAIQVLQHGTRTECHHNVAHACALVAPGGLLAVRVNAAGTQVAHTHEVIEPETAEHGPTVRYTAGPKTGLAIHFFTTPELTTLATTAGLEPLLPPRAHVTRRADGTQWTQWEAIWRRPRSAPTR